MRYPTLKKLQYFRFQFLLSAESQPRCTVQFIIYNVHCSAAAMVQIYCRATENLTAKWCRRKLDIVPEGTTTSSLCPLLKPTAEDLVTTRASQAFVKRNLSICGLLTHGNCNRMTKSLEMHVCLKVN